MMRTSHTTPNDRARHPWDHRPPEPDHPASRPIRWVVRLVALALVALSLYPAIGEDEAADVQVDCGPASVGIATECTATITLAGGTVSTSETGILPDQGRRVRQRARWSALDRRRCSASPAVRRHHGRRAPVPGERGRHEGRESEPRAVRLRERHAHTQHHPARGPVLPRCHRGADRDRRSVAREHLDEPREPGVADHAVRRGHDGAHAVRLRRRVPRRPRPRRPPVQHLRTMHRPPHRTCIHRRRLGARHLRARSIDQGPQWASHRRERSLGAAPSISPHLHPR